MISRDDPPRLRTRAGSLPRQLALALQASSEEDATPEQLEQLASAIRGEVVASDRTSVMFHRFPKRRAPLGRTLAFVVTFALGAGAGVLVSGGVFFATRQAGLTPRDAAKPASRVSSPDASRAGRPAPKREVVSPVEPEAPPVASADPGEPRQRGTVPGPGASTEVAAQPPSPADELALLNRAQAALAQNPALSLMLASDHQRHFRPGTLVQEREMIAIDALLRLGQRPAAEARAARFRQQFPASVHLRRVDVLLGGGTSSSTDHN